MFQKMSNTIVGSCLISRTCVDVNTKRSSLTKSRLGGHLETVVQSGDLGGRTVGKILKGLARRRGGKEAARSAKQGGHRARSHHIVHQKQKKETLFFKTPLGAQPKTSLLRI